MATDIGELVVSLAFDGKNAEDGMKAIRNEIKSMNAGFRAAAAEAGHFGQGLDGTRANAKNLEQVISKQNKLVEESRKALSAAKDGLDKAQASYAEYGKRLSDARKKQDEAKAAVKEANAAYKASIKATGDNSEATIVLGLALEELKDKEAEAGKEVTRLQGQHDACARSVVSAGKNVERAAQLEAQAREELDKTQKALKDANDYIQKHGTSWAKAGESAQAYAKQVGAIADKQVKLGKTLTVGVTTPIVGGLTYAAKSAVSFESAFAGVEKTVDATDQELSVLRQDIIDMASRLPTSAEDIAGVAEAAGQLAIETPQIAKFSEVMIGLSEATDLSLADAPQTLAQFANVMGMSQDEFDRLGSTIVDLGNNTAATESKIVAMGMRLAGAGKQVGMSEAQVLGLAAGLSSVGIEAEAGGSAFSKLISDMQVQVETGGKGLKDYAKVAGMSAKDFAAAFKGDASGAILQFVTGLSKMDEQGMSAIATLQKMGITELRLRDSLLRSSNASAVFSKAMATANNAWEENTALQTEVGKRMKTTESRLRTLGNQAKQVARNVGEGLSPTLDALIEAGGNVVGWLNNMNEETRQSVIQTAMWVAGAGPAILTIGKMKQGVGKVTSGFAAFVKKVGESGGGIKGFTSSIGAMLGPMGKVAALAAGGFAIKYAIDLATGAKAARDMAKSMQDVADAMRETQAVTIYDTGHDAFSALGLSEEDFTGGVGEMRTWLEQVNKVWDDNKKKSGATVKEYVQNFKDGGGDLREAIISQQEALKGLGITKGEDQDRLKKDLKQLDAWDKEVNKILSRSKGRDLSEKEQARLDEIVNQRINLQLEYTVGEGGYKGILKGVEAEKERARLGEKNLSAEVYGDALTAAAKGHSAFGDALDAEYDKQKAIIDLMKNEADKQTELNKLNEWYAENRKSEEEEYKSALIELGKGAKEEGLVQEQMDQLTKLKGLLDDYGDEKPGGLEALEKFTKGLDEGKLASLMSVVTQLNEAGIKEEDLGFDPEGILRQYQTIAGIIDAYPQQLAGLNEIFSSLVPEEVQRIMVELGLVTDDAQVQWDEFMNGKNLIETEISLSEKDGDGSEFRKSLKDLKGELIYVTFDPEKATVEEILATGAVEHAYVPEGVIAEGEASANGQVAYLKLKDGYTVDGTPELKGLVTSAKPADDLSMAAIDTAARITSYWSASAPPPVQVTASITNPQTIQDIVSDADENGIVKVTVQISTAREMIDNLSSDKHVNWLPAFGNNTIGQTLATMAQNAQELEELKKGAPIWDTLFGTGKRNSLQLLSNSLDADNVKDITDTVLNLIGALSSGGEVDSESIAWLQQVVDIVGALEEYDINSSLVKNLREAFGTSEEIAPLLEEAVTLGKNIAGGTGSGMEEYDFKDNADGMIGNALDAGETSADAHSPARKFIPLGKNVAAGMAAGMEEYDFGPSAREVVANMLLSMNPENADIGGAGTKAASWFGDCLKTGLEEVEVLTEAKAIVRELSEYVKSVKLPSLIIPVKTSFAGGGNGGDTGSGGNGGTVNHNTTSNTTFGPINISSKADALLLREEMARIAKTERKGYGS